MKKKTHSELVKEVIFNHYLKKCREEAKNFYSENDFELTQQLVKDINAFGYNVEDFELLNVINLTDERMLPIVEKYLYKFDNLGISTRILGLIEIKGFKEAAKLNIEFYDYLKSLNDDENNHLFVSLDNNLWRIKDKSQMETYRKWYYNFEDHNNLPLTMDMYVRWNKRDPEIREKLIEDLQSADWKRRVNALHELPMFGDKSMIEYVKPLLKNVTPEEAKYYNKIIDKLNKLK